MNPMRSIEIAESAYAIVVRQAAQAGVSPAAWLTRLVEEKCEQASLAAGNGPMNQSDDNSIEQFFGVVNMPSAVGADNDQLDADLAREIMDTHEPR